MKGITRYASVDKLNEAYTKPYPFLKELEMIESLQVVPPPRDEAALLGEEAWECVIQYLDHQSLAQLSGCCRRLRTLVLKNEVLDSVHLVPYFVAHNTINDEAVMQSFTEYFDTYSRGQRVKHIACVNSTYDATLPPVASPPSGNLNWLLQMSGKCPLLSTLDVRGVRWGPSLLLKYFLSDLHLVAPKLQALKIGPEIYDHWVDGWWSRQDDLQLFVLSSRRLQPASSGSEEEAVPSATVLREDFFTMLGAPDRNWCVKVWCPLDESSLKRLLTPTAPWTELVELTVNVEGHVDLFSGQPEPVAPEDAKKGAKAGKKAGGENGDSSAAFPALKSFTVANLDSRPAAVTDWWRKLSLQAPNMAHFNVCNTPKHRLERKESRRARRRNVFSCSLYIHM
ncbi:hypothetical protein AGDE_04117 [Angomonas deanei]|nr:hypothetical protein AGDE_04117 [Angomonas deanei]|eukprot:EPY39811.1 hypothetical protein AGDE_04117 [Angomonas deanei]